MWPEGGGFYDQDDALVRDVLDLLSGHNYYRKLVDEQRRRQLEAERAGQQAGDGGRARSIEELMGVGPWRIKH